MRARQAIAFLALGGLLVSTYLWLYRVGAVGELACVVGACDVVQASRYAVFLGLPVAAWGMIGYTPILALALAGAHPHRVANRTITAALMALTGIGFAFSTYLTALELFVIRAICMWCVISYAIIVGAFGLALSAWLRERRFPREQPAGQRA